MGKVVSGAYTRGGAGKKERDGPTTRRATNESFPWLPGLPGRGENKKSGKLG